MSWLTVFSVLGRSRKVKHLSSLFSTAFMILVLLDIKSVKCRFSLMKDNLWILPDIALVLSFLYYVSVVKRNLNTVTLISYKEKARRTALFYNKNVAYHSRSLLLCKGDLICARFSGNNRRNCSVLGVAATKRLCNKTSLSKKRKMSKVGGTRLQMFQRKGFKGVVRTMSRIQRGILLWKERKFKNIDFWQRPKYALGFL